MVFEKKRPLGEFHASMEQVEEGYTAPPIAAR